MTEIKRCPWANDPYSIEYHDKEWGKINLDENHLFELLILEGFQAGLSWATILGKREAFRRAFYHSASQIVPYTNNENFIAMMN